MQRRKRLLSVTLIIGLVLVVLLSTGGIVTAQVSQRYNMKCWGTFTNAGGVQTSSQYLLLDAFGQQFAGQSVSASYEMRAGSVQVRPAPAPLPPLFENRIYLPVIKAATALGICSW